MALVEKTIAVRSGEIRLTESSGSGMPLVLLHGSGSSRQIFDRQMQGPLAERFRLVALDLPGHGQSSDARNPAKDYTLPGLAQTVGEVLDQLKIGRATVFGWSLGGHIGLELMSFHPAVGGLMLAGAPPLMSGLIGVLRGFRTSFDTALASKEAFSERDVERFARLCFGDRVDPEHIAAIRRADGRLRKIMFGSMLRGECADERRLVETMDVPLAVVNGSDDPFLRLGYIAGLRYRALWDGMCHLLPDAGHAPFLTMPDEFNALLGRFADDVAARRPAVVAPRVRPTNMALRM